MLWAMVVGKCFRLLRHFRRTFSLVLEQSLFSCILTFVIIQIIIVSFFSQDSEVISAEANVKILRYHIVRNKTDRHNLQSNETYRENGNKNSKARNIKFTIHQTRQGSITFLRFRKDAEELSSRQLKPKYKGIRTNKSKLAKENITDLKVKVKVDKPRLDSTETPVESAAERSRRTGRIFGSYAESQEITLSGENLCKTKGSRVIVLITSALNNFKERDAIRHTWGSSCVKNHVEYMFVLGLTKSGEIADRIYKELFEFGDVLIGSFTDSYRNLTLKTLFGFEWILEHCTGVQFIMKTDDDVFINIPNLLQFVEEKSKLLDKGMAGFCLKSEKPIRDKNSKWFVSMEEYPGEKYPDFCSGIGYVTSKTVVQQIIDVADNVTFIHLEDIYVGICLKKLGVVLYNIPHFYQKRPPSFPCFYKESDVILIHNVTPVLLQRIWNAPCDIKFLHSQRYKELLYKIRDINKLV